jgi:hypothetical protein
MLSFSTSATVTVTLIIISFWILSSGLSKGLCLSDVFQLILVADLGWCGIGLVFGGEKGV